MGSHGWVLDSCSLRGPLRSKSWPMVSLFLWLPCISCQLSFVVDTAGSVSRDIYSSSCRKSTGTSACRVSSTPPWTVRCTTRCATGWPWRRPLLRWGKEACKASPWRTATRRTKRTTRHRDFSPGLPHPDPLPFTLLTLAWLPMHVPTQIATLGPLCQLEMPMKELLTIKIVLILKKIKIKMF